MHDCFDEIGTMMAAFFLEFDAVNYAKDFGYLVKPVGVTTNVPLLA